jgi:hypothetical protein
MIDILFVGDRHRDRVTVPRLVERILGVNVREQLADWQDFRVNGYPRKVLFAARVARDAGALGLVATVDTDTDPQRRKFRALVEGREKDRQVYPDFPIAFGEANPHGEA